MVSLQGRILLNILYSWVNKYKTFRRIFYDVKNNVIIVLVVELPSRKTYAKL